MVSAPRYHVGEMPGMGNNHCYNDPRFPYQGKCGGMCFVQRESGGVQELTPGVVM